MSDSIDQNSRQLLHAINNSETVGTVFLDLTKAFDIVNYKLLLQKLAAYKLL